VYGVQKKAIEFFGYLCKLMCCCRDTLPISGKVRMTSDLPKNSNDVHHIP
jgi:hypothetical protein